MNDSLQELARLLSLYLPPLFPEENEPNARRAGRCFKFESIIKKIKANDLHATFGIENNETFLYQLTRELGNRFGEQPLLALAHAAYKLTSGHRADELEQIIKKLEAEADRPAANFGLTDGKWNGAHNKKDGATESQTNFDGVANHSKVIEMSVLPITENSSEHTFVGKPHKGMSPIQPTIVLVTVNKYETQAVLDEFVGAGNKLKNVTKSSVTYNDLGSHAGHQIIHTICEMGPGGVGGSQQRTRDAIDHWQPHAVIAIGIAFGLDDEKQKIGDVLVATQIQGYELSRLNENETVTLRDDKPSSSDPLRNRLRLADTNQTRTAKDWPKVRFGLVLSGQKLVDNLGYRNRLKSLQPEAIGAEMEAVGVYVSASAKKVDWIVVKAICDWGYNKNQEKKDEWQQLAAKNAAHVLKVALDLGPLYATDNAVPPMQSIFRNPLFLGFLIIIVVSTFALAAFSFGLHKRPDSELNQSPEATKKSPIDLAPSEIGSFREIRYRNVQDLLPEADIVFGVIVDLKNSLESGVLFKIESPQWATLRVKSLSGGFNAPGETTDDAFESPHNNVATSETQIRLTSEVRLLVVIKIDGNPPENETRAFTARSLKIEVDGIPLTFDNASGR